MGCNVIHPGGERLPELLDEGPEEPNPARLAQARAEPGRRASYSSTVSGKVRPEEGPVAEEEARGGRGGDDGGRPARGPRRGGGSHGRLRCHGDLPLVAFGRGSLPRALSRRLACAARLPRAEGCGF